MANILAVYGTSYGHTEKLVQRIAQRLNRTGLHVTALKGDRVPASLRPELFDGIIIAASVIGGKHQRYVTRFVNDNVGLLNSRPSAFLSVSGAAASAHPDQLVAAKANLQKFLDQAGWKPTAQTIVAGGFPFTRYGFLTRMVMKRIGRKEGLADFRRDYDFTDWHAVDRFADDFANACAPVAGMYRRSTVATAQHFLSTEEQLH